MAFRSLLLALAQEVPAHYAHGCTPDAGAWVWDPPAVYRPRHPERTIFYQVFENHFDSYLHAYEERFEPRSGPLRPVVPESVEEFLACGRLHGGFARIRCPACRSEHLLAFSCRTRGVCSSCHATRAALFARFCLQWRIDTGPSQSREPSAACSSASGGCSACCPVPPMNPSSRASRPCLAARMSVPAA